MAEPGPQREFPAVGQQIPDTVLTSWVGATVPLTAFRGRANIVLLFLCGGRRRPVELADALIAAADQIQEEDAVFFAVLHGDQAAAAALNAQHHWPGAFLCHDNDGSLHSRFGALDEEGYSDGAVYITDRWGQIYCAIRELARDSLPTAHEVLASLRHLNIMCEECDPGIDWPRDAA